MHSHRIYLDYNATAPLHPAARDAMLRWLDGPHNASSIHQYGREARETLERSRAIIADSLATDASSIIFTASGTEANNHALHSVDATAYWVSAIEHASILAPVAAADKPVHTIPVTPQGVVDTEALEALCVEHGLKNALVSVMMANNETGVIQPIAEIADIVHNHGGTLHCDAAQSYGKTPFTLADLGADLVTISAHKCGGPVGAAALISNGCVGLTPLLRGGGQESYRRAGTENLAAIAGFAAIAEQRDSLYSHMHQLAQWRDALEHSIQHYNSEAQVMGAYAQRLPTTSCITMPGVESATQLMHCDLEGIAVSAGSACTSGKVEPSHVLKAMGIDEDAITCALRISGGWGSTEEDYHAMTQSWKALFDRVGGPSKRTSTAA